MDLGQLRLKLNNQTLTSPELRQPYSSHSGCWLLISIVLLKIFRGAPLVLVVQMPLRAKITATAITTAAKMVSPEDSLKGQLEKVVEEGKIPQGVVFAATGDGTSLVFRVDGARGEFGHGSILADLSSNN